MNQNCQIVWNDCKKIIKDILLSDAEYATWIEPIVPVSLENAAFTIEVPSDFYKEQIEARYSTLIVRVLSKKIGRNAELYYNIRTDSEHPYYIPGTSNPARNIKNKAITSFSVPTDTLLNPDVVPGLRGFVINSNLNNELSFDNWIVTNPHRGNGPIKTLAQNVAQRPGTTSASVLFICGDSGLGKTHLLNAIGIESKETNPELQVLYIPSAEFFREYATACKNNTYNDFMNKYHHVDVLLLDDIQELSGKHKTMDAVFHIFNYLQNAKKQIVLASDKTPAQLEGFEERLLSRFRWGTAIQLEKPDAENRRAILKHKLLQSGIADISDEILDYIVAHTTNVRDMESIVLNILTQVVTFKKPMSLEMVEKIFALTVQKITKKVSVENIKSIVCEFLNVPVDSLGDATRKRAVVQARQISMFFSKKLTQETLKNIGEKCGKRDHTTVIHACKTVEDLIATDMKFKETVERIGQKIRA